MPLPVAAKSEENAPCPNFRKEAGVSVCDFGVEPSQAQKTVALLGDSHASHWRAPLNIIARERGWRGLSVTRTSCVFSAATKLTPEPTRSQCLHWVRSVPKFFRKHPEIDTVFVVAITGGRVNVPRGPDDVRGEDQRRAQGVEDAARHRQAHRRHPRHAADHPQAPSSASTGRSRPSSRAGLHVRRAAQRGARGRSRGAIAARKEHSPRLQAIDLTDVFCSERLCFPVIGGALVYKDLHHFTLVFAETLAAPLGRKIEALTQEWSQSALTTAAGALSPSRRGPGQPALTASAIIALR